MSAKNAPRRGIELHGWDSQTRTWHGPDELTFHSGNRRIVNQLRRLPGSWHGRLRPTAPGGLPFGFCASIHDLRDSGVAMIDMDGTPGGPLHFVLVVPAGRRLRLREDLAFEFLSFVRFLQGPEGLGSELAIHDYIQRVLHQNPAGATLVFSLEGRALESDLHRALSEQAEMLAMSMIAWMAEMDSEADVDAEVDVDAGMPRCGRDLSVA